jgi:broad specificity phosphatase PhoE
MATIEGLVRFPLTAAGVEQARIELEGLASRLVARDVSAPSRAGDDAAPTSRGKVLFDHLDPTSRGRELLQLLPEGKDRALTPAELASRMAPASTGEPLKPGSVRAVIRNLWRGAEHLKARGVLDSRVVQRHFEDYHRDGAGRYYLEPGDGRGIPGR